MWTKTAPVNFGIFLFIFLNPNRRENYFFCLFSEEQDNKSIAIMFPSPGESEMVPQAYNLLLFRALPARLGIKQVKYSNWAPS